MSDTAKEAKKAYMREWRRKNPEKVKAAQMRFWTKKWREMQCRDGEPTATR